MVGCSGEEFASILRALGFRLERRKVSGGNGAAEPAKAEHVVAAGEAPEDAPAEPPQDEQSSEAAPQIDAAAALEPAFDEIWRPGKRRESRPQRAGPGAHKPGAANRPPRQGKNHGKSRQEDRGQTRPQDRPRQSKRERSAPEHSPFAALKELRDSLAARGRPERS